MRDQKTIYTSLPLPVRRQGCGETSCSEYVRRHAASEFKLRTYQPKFEQFGDDPVEHPSVVLLIDLVGDLLDDVFCRQRSAVHLTEALCVI